MKFSDLKQKNISSYNLPVTLESLEIRFSSDVALSYKNLDIYKKGEHFFSRYTGQNTLDNLFELQINQNFAHICLLFTNENVETVLRHINVYDFFVYTMIPERIDFETFEKIYDFYFYSPLSVSHITWIGSLIFSPQVSSNEVIVNHSIIKLGNCGDCFLKERNCSKIVPFMNTFHPEKPFNLEEINIMCEILRYFSQKVYQDFNEKFHEEDLHAFSMARKSVGIKNHYWLNPWGIY